MHSIRWKILWVFFALIVFMSLAVSVFFVRGITVYYNEDFKETMSSHALTSDIMLELTEASMAQEPVPAIRDVLILYSGRLGIDSYRNFYILDRNGICLYGSDGYTGAMNYSANVLLAMSGKIGDTATIGAKQLDYAQPLLQDGTVSHIIYIVDDKTELRATMRNMISTIFYALLIGIMLSVMLSIILSRTITAPLATLEKQAANMATGKFTQPIPASPGKDEISSLTTTFNNMALWLMETMQTLNLEKNKLETILERLNDGVMAFDTEGKPLHINSTARMLLRLAPDEAPNFDTLFASLDADITLDYVLSAPIGFATERKLATDRTVMQAYFAGFFTQSNQISGVVVALQDVTEWEKLDASRREFVANVSHELRTPLSTIKSYTETLTDILEEPDETTRHFLSTIDRETDRMTRMVKDLLTLSSLGENARLKYERFPLPGFLASIAENLSHSFREKGQTLTCCFPEDMPYISADKDRIAQVVINLLTNASKYSPENTTVTLTCGQDNNMAMIRVTDQGIGIAPENLPRIFERFYRVDKARSRSAGGTGLGLAIAKEITEAHGGSIFIESQIGLGTEITVLLPFSPKATS